MAHSSQSREAAAEALSPTAMGDYSLDDAETRALLDFLWLLRCVLVLLPLLRKLPWDLTNSSPVSIPRPSSSVRTVFSILTMSAWGERHGIIRNTTSEALRMTFLVSDRVPTVLFFSLFSVLTLFWAELHYIAIDEYDVSSVSGPCCDGRDCLTGTVFVLDVTWNISTSGVHKCG